MKKLVIIGASAMGRETCGYARECGISVKGFLDSRIGLLDCYSGYPPIVSSVEDYDIDPEDVFVCAIGDPLKRCHYVETIKNKGGAFVSIVHHLAYVGQNVRIGVGCIVCPNVSITSDVIIGDHVILNTHSSINHDCNIGDYSTISPGCHIAGWCNIGAKSFMGIHSAIIPHASLGEGVYVAAGGVVTKSIETGRVMGIPARPK